MRRAEKAVDDPDILGAILREAPFLTLVIPDGGENYPVPLSFGTQGRWSDPSDPLELWIHGAREGRKWELFRKLSGSSTTLSFSAVADAALKDGGDKACAYSVWFRSVIGTAKLAIADDDEEQRRGLGAIMAHYRPEQEFTFPERMLSRTGLVRLRVLELSGKMNLPGDS